MNRLEIVPNRMHRGKALLYSNNEGKSMTLFYQRLFLTKHKYTLSIIGLGALSGVVTSIESQPLL